MIWLKPSPQAPTEGRYYDVFEYMFIFSKGKPKTLNLLKDRKIKAQEQFQIKKLDPIKRIENIQDIKELSVNTLGDLMFGKFQEVEINITPRCFPRKVSE